jgi:phosphate/sulfate permease
MANLFGLVDEDASGDNSGVVSSAGSLSEDKEEDNDSLAQKKEILSPSDQSADEPQTVASTATPNSLPAFGASAFVNGKGEETTTTISSSSSGAAIITLQVVDEERTMVEDHPNSTTNNKHNSTTNTMGDFEEREKGSSKTTSSSTNHLQRKGLAKAKLSGEESTTPSTASSSRGGGMTGANSNNDTMRTASDPGEPAFIPLLIIAAFTSAYAHGGNDIGNSVGPLAAIMMVNDTNEVAKSPDIPIWALLYGCVGFLCGILAMGKFTIKTVANSLMVLTPSRSFAIQIGAALAVLISSVFGLPVSTSHCLVGSVVGIGFLEKYLMKKGEVNSRMLLRILASWVITIPAAMGTSLVCYGIGERYYRNL